MKKILVAILIVFTATSCDSDSNNNLEIKEATLPREEKEVTIARTVLDTVIVAERRGLYELTNLFSQSTFDATKTYLWKVVEVTTPDRNKWMYSICDLNACYPPFASKGEFKFSASTGIFKIDWKNYNSTSKDENGNYTEALTTGICSLKIIFYPKEGGDTITYTSTMSVAAIDAAVVAEKEIAIDRPLIDTTITVERRALYKFSNSLRQASFDPTKIYEWKVIEMITPDRNKWMYSICDLGACYPPLATKGQFSFSSATGIFEIDWKNYNSTAVDDSGIFTEPVSTGICSMTIIIYPKGGGGDTIQYTSTLNAIAQSPQ